MAWIYLFVAGLFEVFWAVGLKLSNGFSQPVINVITVLGMIASFYFLAIALKNIPLGTAYAVWTGIGTIGTVILGIILFQIFSDRIGHRFGAGGIAMVFIKVILVIL